MARHEQRNLRLERTSSNITPRRSDSVEYTPATASRGHVTSTSSTGSSRRGAAASAAPHSVRRAAGASAAPLRCVASACSCARTGSHASPRPLPVASLPSGRDQLYDTEQRVERDTFFAVYCESQASAVRLHAQSLYSHA